VKENALAVLNPLIMVKAMMRECGKSAWASNTLIQQRQSRP